jgi:alpha-glucosidase
VLGNHDQHRLATRVGPAQARVANMLLLTLRGTPTCYYGDEIGLENGVIPPEKIQDPQGINLGAHRSRDVARTPMQWDASPNAGFSTVEPWLPVSADYTTRNVSAESRAPTSTLSLYCRLFWLRRGSSALSGVTYRPNEVEGNVYGDVRESAGAPAGESERKLVALNFDAQPVTAVTGLTGSGRVLLSTHMDREGETTVEKLQLRPFEGLVIDLPV